MREKEPNQPQKDLYVLEALEHAATRQKIFEAKINEQFTAFRWLAGQLKTHWLHKAQKHSIDQNEIDAYLEKASFQADQEIIRTVLNPESHHQYKRTQSVLKDVIEFIVKDPTLNPADQYLHALTALYQLNSTELENKKMLLSLTKMVAKNLERTLTPEELIQIKKEATKRCLALSKPNQDWINNISFLSEALQASMELTEFFSDVSFLSTQEHQEWLQFGTDTRKTIEKVAQVNTQLARSTEKYPLLITLSLARAIQIKRTLLKIGTSEKNIDIDFKAGALKTPPTIPQEKHQEFAEAEKLYNYIWQEISRFFDPKMNKNPDDHLKRYLVSVFALQYFTSLKTHHPNNKNSHNYEELITFFSLFKRESYSKIQDSVRSNPRLKEVLKKIISVAHHQAKNPTQIEKWNQFEYNLGQVHKALYY